MNFNLPLGRWLGIPVILHWSWVLIFVLVVIGNPSHASVYLGLFCLVLLHELGHSMAGRYLNFPTHDITLYPFGGLARMQIPAEPRQEMFVALAGPAVNLCLFPIFLILQQYNLCLWLGYCNTMLLVFNLVPALPMDGGRVLRSILAIALNNRCRATVIAARVSQVICVGFVVFSLYTGMYMLMIIAFFIFVAASGEIEESKKRLSREGCGAILDSAEALRSIQNRLDRLDK